MCVFRTPPGRPGPQEQRSSISSIKNRMDGSQSHSSPRATSHPASAIKLKTSPTKKHLDEDKDRQFETATSGPLDRRVSKSKKAKKTGSASPANMKQLQQSSEHSKVAESGTPEKSDQFSAALDALSKINLSDMPSPTSKSSPAPVKLLSRSMEPEDSKDASASKIEKSVKVAAQNKLGSANSNIDTSSDRTDRELSPSVSAMFEAVKSGSHVSASKQQPLLDHPDTAALKSMLNIASSLEQTPYARGRGKISSSSPGILAEQTPRGSGLLHTPPYQGVSPRTPISPQTPPLLGNYPHGSRPIHATPPSQLPDSVAKLFRPPRGNMAHTTGRGERDQGQQRPPLIHRHPFQPPRRPQNPYPGKGYILPIFRRLVCYIIVSVTYTILRLIFPPNSFMLHFLI